MIRLFSKRVRFEYVSKAEDVVQAVVRVYLLEHRFDFDTYVSVLHLGLLL